MTVVLVANGGRGSAAAERAERIARAFGTGAEVLVRDGSRTSSVLELARSLRAVRPEAVYAVDLASVPLGAWLLGARRAPLVVDTGDAPLDFLRLIGAGVGARGAAWAMEELAYRRATTVVVRGPHHATVLRDRGVRAVEVVFDGVDLDVVRPIVDDAARERLGLTGKLTVGISGNFTWYPQLGGGLGWELVEAMALRPDLEIHAVLIGAGPGIERLRVLAEARGVGDRLHVLGRVPYGELARNLGLCDVCLLTQTNDPSSQIRTTGKLPVYLAAGRYVLASRVGTAATLLPDEMLVDYHGAWDPGYPARLAERLAAISVDPDRAAKGLALRSLAERFEYGAVAQQAADVLRRAVA